MLVIFGKKGAQVLPEVPTWYYESIFAAWRRSFLSGLEITLEITVLVSIFRHYPLSRSGLWVGPFLGSDLPFGEVPWKWDGSTFGNILSLLVKVMFYVTLYIVNFPRIVSSTSQTLLFVPFDAGFCACFLVFSVLGNLLSYFWLWHATYLDFLENDNPVCSGILCSSLYEETQVYLKLMLIASSAYFVCKVVNGGKKAGVVLFDSDLQNT